MRRRPVIILNLGDSELNRNTDMAVEFIVSWN
jgi:hypothetical protein